MNMHRRTFVTTVAASATALAVPARALARMHSQQAASTGDGDEMTTTAPQTGYAPVNGLQMYYEIHGSGEPLVLLHGAYMTIGSFGPLLPALAERRRVIAVEFQGHGHTADVDRPMTYDSLSDDTAAFMRYLGFENIDVFGYSMGGGVALRLAMRQPELVRKLVAASASYRLDGLYPEVLAGIASITPEMMEQTPWYAEYARVAPNPDNFPALVAKLKQLDAAEFAWPEEEVRSIAAPTLLIFGDSDVISLDHMVKLFRLLGGGVPGDLTGLPKARLAVLPGTTHVTVIDHVNWLTSMIGEFLAAPLPEAS
jgi:pimeloyl-ACP methyl ester carboxylesterase